MLSSLLKKIKSDFNWFLEKQKSKSFWLFFKNIINIGIDNNTLDIEKINIKFVNIISIFIAFFLSFVIAPLSLISTPEVIWVAVFNFIHSLMIFCTIFLQKNKKFHQARLYLISLGYLGLIFNLVLFGKESFIYLFFIATIMGGFMIFPLKQRIYAFFNALFSLLLIIYFAIFYDYKSIILLTQKEINTYTNINMLGISFILAILAMINYLFLSYSDSKLRNEKNHINFLLNKIYPENILKMIQENNGNSFSKKRQKAGVMFFDIVGFTKITSKKEPLVISEFLNEVFSFIDIYTKKYQLQKIKTIGDAYLVTTNLENEEYLSDIDLAKLILFAFDLFNDIKNKKFKIGDEEVLIQLRCGVDVGAVIYGIQEKNHYFFDLWGETVSVAQRMEQTSVPGRIQVSENVYQALIKYFHFEIRENQILKNMENMQTYLVCSVKKNFFS